MPSSALLCDLYELTMAQAYWQAGVAQKKAVFHLFFRKAPFGWPFAILCGLGPAIEWLQDFRLDSAEVAYLQELKGNDTKPLFSPQFLQQLCAWDFHCNLDAIPEGTAVFPNEPVLRISGPVLQCQILESCLLNLINFQSLIATKAARVCLAAGGDKVVEFGLRRAQGPDGALGASRAAYVGGCDGTSNALAGQRYSIPVSGTQAHSWIMFFDDELQAFDAYARALPNNCIFLVDTYNSLQGVRNAIAVGQFLRSQGKQMIGVRLDSGDIASLSQQTRELLRDGGLEHAIIVASGDLDEFRISGLKEQGATVDVWGVGSKLATGHSDAFLGGVYKLSAVEDTVRDWSYRLKLSEEKSKTSVPGILQVLRSWDAEGTFLEDTVYDLRHHPQPGSCKSSELLVPIFREGKLVYEVPSPEQARIHAKAELARLPPVFKKLRDAPAYEPKIEEFLQRLQNKLIAEQKTKAHFL